MGTDLSLFFPRLVSLGHHEGLAEEVEVIVENSRVLVNDSLFGEHHVSDGFHVMDCHTRGQEQLLDDELGNLSELAFEVQLFNDMGEDERHLLGLGYLDVLEHVGHDSEDVRVGSGQTDANVLIQIALDQSVVCNQWEHDEVHKRDKHRQRDDFQNMHLLN